MKLLTAGTMLAVLASACGGGPSTETRSPTISSPEAASPAPTTWTQVATFSGKGELKTAPFDLHAGQARLRITWQGGLKHPSASSSGAVYVIRPGDGWPGDEQLFLSQEPGSIEQLFLSQEPGSIEQAFYPDASGPRYLSIEPRDNVRSWAVVVEELR